MDSTETVTHVSLCAGYGGIDLGLKRAIPHLRTVAFSEIEAFACANMVAKMEAGLLDAAPIWSNLKTFPWDSFRGKVDILSGGYPCQPFSSAGKRLGADDPRHLWPFIADGIARMQPGTCFFENVEGHITLGLRNVLQDLAGMGYRTTWGIFSAAEVGAPHQRKRVFILAHRKCEGLERWVSRVQSESNRRRASNHLGASGDLLGKSGYGTARTWAESVEAKLSSFGIASFDVADSLRNGGGEIRFVRQGTDGAISFSNGESWRTWPSRPGQPQHEWEPPRTVGDTERPEWRKDNHWVAGEANKGASDATSSDWRKTEPPVGGDIDGLAGGMDYAKLCVSCDNRTDELRLLGNGVVPATAERAFLTLIERLK